MSTLVYFSLRKVDSENKTIQLKSRLGLIKYHLSYLILSDRLVSANQSEASSFITRPLALKELASQYCNKLSNTIVPNN